MTAPGDPTRPDTVTEADAPGDAPGDALAGYQLGELLGRGGMGEVVLARDATIGRDVALKRMRGAAASADATARFLREAKLQARLDHPAIVPVHEVGLDAGGRPYFTMKRLAGTTLRARMADPSAPARELLRAFTDVCLAIEFAHARGVVHRDLKPANIMLGDFGEVYVLDWGIARVIADVDDPAAAAAAIADPGAMTQVGALLGTPGYMAPEQVAGEPVTPAADVYALGAILFELLAGEPLHPAGGAAIEATLDHPTDAPARRAPERGIAPELDAACVAALAAEPASRPTARELATRVRRYLDGDRDLERRRALATEQLAAAEAALATGDPARRADAMRAAGRALALDPGLTPAAQLVSSLMLEPPRELPPSLRAELATADGGLATVDARSSAVAHACFFASLPLVLWNQVVAPLQVAAAYGLSAVLAVWWGRIARQRRAGGVAVAIVLNTALLLVVGRLLGPFVITPVLLATTAGGLVTRPEVIERPWALIPLSLAALAPLVLEPLGWFGTTWDVAGGAVIARSTLIEVGGTPTMAVLVVATLTIPIVGALYNRSIAIARRDAHRRLAIQAWHLRQLVAVDA